MSAHDAIKQAAISAARKLHSDMSVSSETTLASLLELRDEIEVMADAVGNDIETAGQESP